MTSAGAQLSQCLCVNNNPSDHSVNYRAMRVLVSKIYISFDQFISAKNFASYLRVWSMRPKMWSSKRQMLLQWWVHFKCWFKNLRWWVLKSKEKPRTWTASMHLDINECALTPNPCSSPNRPVCSNYNGSYHCHSLEERCILKAGYTTYYNSSECCKQSTSKWK